MIHDFTAEGIGLMYSQAHVTAEWDGLTISISTSSISLCKSMAHVIEVTKKGASGSMGVSARYHLVLETGTALALGCAQFESHFERPKRVSEMKATSPREERSNL